MDHHILHDTSQQNRSPSIINLGVGQTIYSLKMSLLKDKLPQKNADFPSSFPYWTAIIGCIHHFSDHILLVCCIPWKIPPFFTYPQVLILIHADTSWYLIFSIKAPPKIIEKSPVNQLIHTNPIPLRLNTPQKTMVSQCLVGKLHICGANSEVFSRMKLSPSTPSPSLGHRNGPPASWAPSHPWGTWR